MFHNKIKYFVFTVLLLICINCYPQMKLMDSLLKSMREDTLTAYMLDSLSYRMARKSKDTALILGIKSYEISSKINYKNGIANSSNTLGYIYMIECNYEKALFYYKQSLQLAREINDHKLEARTLNNIGLIYKRISCFDISVQYYLECLKLREKMKDTSGIINTYNGLGSLYLRLKKYQLAIDYYTKGLSLANLKKNNFMIGIFYSNLGLVNIEFEKHEIAIEFLFKALPLLKKEKQVEQIATAYNHIGNVYLKKNKLDSSRHYFLQSLDYAKKINYKESMLDNYVNLAEITYGEGQKSNALNQYFDAEKKAIEYKNIYKLRDIYKRIHKLLNELNDLKNAYTYQAKYIKLNDSIFNIESMNKITELNTIYEVNKKDYEIEMLSKDKLIKDSELKKSRILIYSFLAIAVILILSSLLLFKAYRNKIKMNELLTTKNFEIEQQKIEIQSQRDNLELLNEELNKQKEFISNQRDEIEKELQQTIVKSEKLEKEKIQFQFEALKNQVNPHFLFNNFSTLVNLIPESPSIAAKYVLELSNVYRYILTTSDNQLNKLSDELNFIASYMFLVNIRFDNHIKLNVLVHDESKEYFLPMLSLQLLVENAIKHNIINSKKNLYISIATIGDTLEVKNNLQRKTSVENSTGLGLKNIVSRYMILTDKQVEIETTMTEFIVRIPLLKMR